MIRGQLKALDSIGSLLRHPAWQRAFAWLKEMPATPSHGIQPILGDDMYVNVMAYETLAPEKGRFESHRKYVDLQYTIEGAELIDWALSSDLDPDGPYDAEKDLQFYYPMPTRSTAHMLPGHFGIFFPCDAHRPKVTDGLHASAFKLVIKINVKLLD